MKPKYEMKQMVAYWNGEIGRKAEVIVSKVCEIHQTDEGVEYKLRQMGGMGSSLEECAIYGDLESLKEDIREKSERLVNEMFIDCGEKFAATQGNSR